MKTQEIDLDATAWRRIAWWSLIVFDICIHPVDAREGSRRQNMKRGQYDNMNEQTVAKPGGWYICKKWINRYPINVQAFICLGVRLPIRA